MEKKIFSDYRELLKFEYSVRHKRTSSYSMKTFAEDLNLSPSRLSEILSGQQGLSPSRAQEVGKRIGYTEEKVEWFCKLVQAQSARSQIERETATEELKKIPDGIMGGSLDVSQIDFKLKWYHLAIRRMTQLKDFKAEPEWISKYLGLSVQKTGQALQELYANQLLSKDLSGRIYINNNFVFKNDDNQKQSLLKIARYFHWRSFFAKKNKNPMSRMGAHVLTIDSSLYPELLDIVKDFENKIDHLTYRSQNADSLISVLVSVFPLKVEE